MHAKFHDNPSIHWQAQMGFCHLHCSTMNETHDNSQHNALCTDVFQISLQSLNWLGLQNPKYNLWLCSIVGSWMQKIILQRNTKFNDILSVGWDNICGTSANAIFDLDYWPCLHCRIMNGSHTTSAHHSAYYMHTKFHEHLINSGKRRVSHLASYKLFYYIPQISLALTQYCYCSGSPLHTNLWRCSGEPEQ